MDATDLDAVLENISLLIEDMEENINETKKSRQKLLTKTQNTTLQTNNNDEEPIREHTPPSPKSTAPTPPSRPRDIPPVIRHDFTHKSTSEMEPFETSHIASIDNAVHYDELQKAKEASGSKNNIIKHPLNDHRGRRLCCSAENSPILSRSMISRQNIPSPREQRTNSITPRLVLQNIDKFDVTVQCPDGNLFKAGVFKAWTSFQLAWKIAHVRGMAEKIALIIEEHISDLHIKRLIEDHEIIHKVTTNWAPDSNNILVMSERISKYDLFNEPADYLPIEMFDTRSDFIEQPKNVRRSSLLRSIMTADQTPDLQGWVFVKAFDKQKWKKRFLRIKDKIVYTCETDDENSEIKAIYRCDECYFYDCLAEFQVAHKTPYPHCFCIIPKVVTSWHEIKCFCTTSERHLIGWMSGFRFAKYGQQLYTNFREAMVKEANLRRTNSARVSLLFRRSFGDNNNTKDNKATVDFSGQNGRVISDPMEALKIQSEMAFEIPKQTKRSSGTFPPSSIRQNVLDKKIWYHGKLDREQATKKLKKHGSKEGLFLVRESNSTHGNLVLTVITKKGRVSHHQIFKNKNLYGIEHGPQFNSLELLIEAYHSGAVEGADFSLKKACPI
eukprot:TCONS_00003763-protein